MLPTDTIVCAVCAVCLVASRHQSSFVVVIVLVVVVGVFLVADLVLLSPPSSDYLPAAFLASLSEIHSCSIFRFEL